MVEETYQIQYYVHDQVIAFAEVDDFKKGKLEILV